MRAPGTSGITPGSGGGEDGSGANPENGLHRRILFGLDHRVAAAPGGDDDFGDPPPVVITGGVTPLDGAIHFFSGAKFRVPAKLIQQLESCIQNFCFLHFSPPGDHFLVQLPSIPYCIQLGY